MQPDPDDPYLASRRTNWENNGQIIRTVDIAQDVGVPQPNAVVVPDLHYLAARRARDSR
jgi:hypothetical protein